MERLPFKNFKESRCDYVVFLGGRLDCKIVNKLLVMNILLLCWDGFMVSLRCVWTLGSNRLIGILQRLITVLPMVIKHKFERAAM